MPERQQQADVTRDRILKAASVIISDKGYTRATTRSIAKAAGVNEVTIFRHFGSKRNLLSEMIHKHSALPDLTTIIENQLTGDYRQDLIHLGTVFFKAITERKEALRMMLCEAKELPEVREVIVKVPDQLRLVVTRYFQKKMDEGTLREMNPEVMAQGFLGMFFAYGIAREMLDLSIAPDVPQAALIAQFVDIFINGTLQT
jgi:AcrR family transcriptional regulator